MIDDYIMTQQAFYMPISEKIPHRRITARDLVPSQCEQAKSTAFMRIIPEKASGQGIMQSGKRANVKLTSEGKYNIYGGDVQALSRLIGRG